MINFTFLIFPNNNIIYIKAFDYIFQNGFAISFFDFLKFLNSCRSFFT